MTCRPLPDHFMVSQTEDAGLYDCRQPGWMHNPPLRRRYAFHSRCIASTHDLKAALRAGSTTDLGGYPLYFVTHDGDVMSFEGVRDNLAHELYAVWKQERGCIVALEINYEDNGLYCNQTGERIPSAYASDDDLSLVANGGVINPDKENPL